MQTTQDTVVTAGSSLLGPKQRKLVGRMGPWQLVRLLGEGAMTRVYLSRPLDAPESTPAYAVKTLRREWWRDEQAIEMLRREAWVGRHANSPHLAPVLASQVTQPPFYLVFPRLSGETLAERLERGESVSMSQTLWIARQVAEALAALYRDTGMIHCDVKPSNIHISPDGHATLLDFGFCQTALEARSWASRPVMGTLNYIAPERVTSACAADPRSDLYSLGVTLYQMLTGELPLTASDPTELVIMHRQAKPRCLRDACPGIAKPVASLVHRLLAKDPMRRPSYPEEVVRELVRLEIDAFAAA